MKTLNLNISQLTKKDEIWNGWGINSIESFNNIFSGIDFDPEISEDIIKRFEVVKKLLLYSYFVYEFLDVALERTLLTFEFALKNRYHELTGKKTTDKHSSLFALIKWGAEQELFEEDEKMIHSLRKLRNVTAHPNSFQLYGHLAIDTILHTVDLINGLYEKVDLRKARKQEEIQINSTLANLLKKGVLLEVNNKRIIIFTAILVFFNNKVKPTIYHFLFWPIFNPNVKNDRVAICEPIIIHCNHCEFKNEFVHFTDIKGKKFKLTKILKTENIQKFSKWKRDFEASAFPLSYLINLRIGRLRISIRKNSMPGKIKT